MRCARLKKCQTGYEFFILAFQRVPLTSKFLLSGPECFPPIARLTVSQNKYLRMQRQAPHRSSLFFSCDSLKGQPPVWQSLIKSVFLWENISLKRCFNLIHGDIPYRSHRFSGALANLSEEVTWTWF